MYSMISITESYFSFQLSNPVQLAPIVNALYEDRRRLSTFDKVHALQVNLATNVRPDLPIVLKAQKQWSQTPPSATHESA